MEQNVLYNEYAERDIHNKYVDLMSNAGFKAVFADENNNAVLPGAVLVSQVRKLLLQGLWQAEQQRRGQECHWDRL